MGSVRDEHPHSFFERSIFYDSIVPHFPPNGKSFFAIYAYISIFAPTFHLVGVFLLQKSPAHAARRLGRVSPKRCRQLCASTERPLPRLCRPLRIPFFAYGEMQQTRGQSGTVGVSAHSAGCGAGERPIGVASGVIDARSPTGWSNMRATSDRSHRHRD